MIQGVSPKTNYIRGDTLCQHFFWKENNNMPSQKAQILVRTTDENKTKLNIIADKEKRSLSNMAEVILENYIDQYEKEHGTIEIKKSEQI